MRSALEANKYGRDVAQATALFKEKMPAILADIFEQVERMLERRLFRGFNRIDITTFQTDAVRSFNYLLDKENPETLCGLKCIERSRRVVRAVGHVNMLETLSPKFVSYRDNQPQDEEAKDTDNFMDRNLFDVGAAQGPG